MDPLIADLLPAVEEQLNSTDTPYVTEALAMLTQDLGENISTQEAKEMIAFCLADELDKMTAEGRAFDPTRYQTLLKLLPALPE